MVSSSLGSKWAIRDNLEDVVGNISHASAEVVDKLWSMVAHCWDLEAREWFR